MPIEVKELIVRAWVNTVADEKRHESKMVAKRGSETSHLNQEILEQLKRMISDKKDR